jgi:hypothetical protein
MSLKPAVGRPHPMLSVYKPNLDSFFPTTENSVCVSAWGAYAGGTLTGDGGFSRGGGGGAAVHC